METICFADTAVGELVRQRPQRSRVFEQFGVDYCCGGKVSLRQACEKKNVNLDEVCENLKTCDQAPDRSEGLVDADLMTLTELANHIESTHHAYLKEEIPRLEWMTEKVARVHGEKDERLHALRKAFTAFRAEVEPHLMKEERILFPIVRQLEAADGPQEFHCGSVANPIRQMELEHDHAGDELATMHEATDGFVPPEWACNTYRALLSSLAELEQDMHQHIHKENNVLFPKAIQLESQRG
ncbi:iron-sulfur cluster repair di-iron protein [Novipirellula artificiosorum]|uniref:Iron-sulfur cluster repair protein YtfE n=1 Tax=Novipirellula artificiosorum TaxID=2528016 RepID=A0A5C6DAK2_9BACT|nr:iron-sulfur cluster repair di-iron protein [Novipirellula artificiosorum]TWU33930.1 Iron-sulfur cluster repair protein YtfE [Novipirellula artificiosorum]